MQLRRPKTLRKLSSNPGIRAAYRRAIEGMLKEMHTEVFNAVLEEYDAACWRMARDSAWRSPSQRMEEKLAVLIERWNKRFGNSAMRMAKNYLKRVWALVRADRKSDLAESTGRDLGFTHGIWVHVPGMKMSRPTH